MDTEYEKKCKILMRDCDRYKHLRPSAALTMFQDCSEELTSRWGVGLETMLGLGVGWVAAKVGCTVTRVPWHGETVIVRGHAGRSRATIHPFLYQMVDADGKSLMHCCALWVLSDLSVHSMLSKKVPRITLPTPESEDASLPRMAPILPETVFETAKRRVLYSETDINGHLTNTRYLDWVCDLPEAAYHEKRAMRGFRIDYRAEIAPDEEAVLEWHAGGERLWCRCPGKFEAEITY